MKNITSSKKQIGLRGLIDRLNKIRIWRFGLAEIFIIVAFVFVLFRLF